MCVTGATCVPSWGDYCTGGSETEGGGCWGPASPQPCLGTSITPTLPMGMSPPKRAAWATHVASSPLSPPQPAWGSRWGHPKAICLPDWGQAEGAGDQFPHPHLSRRQSCPHRSCCHLPDPSRVSLPCLGHLPRSPRPGGGSGLLTKSVPTVPVPWHHQDLGWEHFVHHFGADDLILVLIPSSAGLAYPRGCRRRFPIPN